MVQKSIANETATTGKFVNRFRNGSRILKGLIIIGLGLMALYRVFH